MLLINIILTFFLLFFILVIPNAIHALLFLILLFLNFAFLLFLMDSSFLAFSYILVYIGAICVLFLYMVILLHLRAYSLIQRINFLLCFSVIILFSLSFMFLNGDISFFQINTAKINVDFLTDLHLFSLYLFESHILYMIFGIFLLLVALILSIFLTVSYRKNIDKIQLFGGPIIK